MLGRRLPRDFQFWLEGSHHRAGETVDDALSGKRNQLHRSLLPRLESHRRSSGDVETKASRRRAIEGERTVGFGEVIMRADLNRPIARVGDGQSDRGSAG